MNRKLALSLSALTLALPMAALAGTSPAARKQADTAAAHAGMAMAASDLKTSHMHLHHAINCLSGPKGQGFDMQAADPCKDMGHGAIVDAKGDARAEATLKHALQQAEQGLMTTRLSASQADAQQVMTTLQAIDKP